MEIDVYHSGRGKLPRAPFAFVACGVVKLPDHPGGDKVQWNYWKQSPLKAIAVAPNAAELAIGSRGYFIQ